MFLKSLSHVNFWVNYWNSEYLNIYTLAPSFYTSMLGCTIWVAYIYLTKLQFSNFSVNSVKSYFDASL